MKLLRAGGLLSGEGRISGVPLADDNGVSKALRIGVKLLSSRSLLTIGTGVKDAGVAFTGVKPPGLTGVKPDDARAS